MATAAATKAKAVPMASPPKFRAARYITLSLGLVTVRCGIAPFKTDPKNGGGHYICEDHKVQVKQRWYCEAGDHYIERLNDKGETVHQPVTGYPFGDQYVILDKKKLDEIAVPKQDALAFEYWDDHLDPVWVEKTYLLQADTDAGVGVLDAFAASMRDNGIVLFGTVCLGVTTHMMALKWSEDMGTLVLHQLQLASRLKLREASDSAAGIMNRPTPPTKVVNEVKRTVNNVTTKGAVHDTPDYARDALMSAVEEIATGGMLKTKKKTAEKPKEVDLMSALRASVDQAQKQRAKKTARQTARKGAEKRRK